MYYTTDAHIDAHLAELDRAEAAAEWADREFGEGWEENAVDPDFRRFIPEREVDDLSVERGWLDWMDDMAAFEGFHN